MNDSDGATFSASMLDEADCLVLRQALEFYREASRRSCNTPPISDAERRAGLEVMQAVDRLLRGLPAPPRGSCGALGLVHGVSRSRRH